MRVRAILVILLCMLGGLNVPYGDAVARSPRTAVVLIKTQSGPSSFVLGLAATYQSGTHPGLFASFGGRSRTGRFDNLLVGRVGAVARDESALVVRPSGVEPVTCGRAGRSCPSSGLVTTTTFYSDEGEATAPNRWFGIIEGADTNVSFVGHGWKLKRVPLTYRYSDDSDGDPSILQYGPRAVSFLNGTFSRPGGKQGSIAIATAACSNALVAPLNSGAARVTLSGSAAPQTISCPSSLPPFAIAAATAATTWTWSGFSAGDDTQLACRLFVMDLPRGL